MYDRTMLMLGMVAVLALAWAAPAQAGLVGYWHYNEGSGSTAHDFSANNNDGAISGLTWVPGHTGAGWDYALDVPGNSEYVGVPDSASFDQITTNNTFTIAFWANEQGGTNYGHLVATTSNYSNRNWLFQTDSFGGDSTYVWSDTDGAWQQQTGWVLPNGWHHVAITYDGSTMKTYLDGSNNGTYSMGGATFPNFSGHIYFGGWLAGGRSLNGQQDDVIIFDTVENVSDIMNGTHSAMPEPATLALLGLGGMGMLLGRKRRR